MRAAIYLAKPILTKNGRLNRKNNTFHQVAGKNEKPDNNNGGGSSLSEKLTVKINGQRS
jgi:hypothetical protein